MRKHDLEIADTKRKGKETTIIIKGNELDLEWLDSYILIWSGREHPFKNKREEDKADGVKQK